MTVALGVWSRILVPGEDPAVIEPPADIKITNVALGDELTDATGRTTVKLIYRPLSAEMSDSEDEDDEKSEPTNLATTVICSLTPGRIESSVVDIILQEQNEYLLEVVGKNTVYLTGYYIEQRMDESPYDDSDSDMSEDAFRLEDVSSDVEVNPEDMDSDASRFEEVEEETIVAKSEKSLKRSRDSDIKASANASDSPAEKKQNKKLKASNGSAVAMDTDETPKTADGEKKSKKDKKKDKKADASAGAETSSLTNGEAKVLQGGLKLKDIKPGSGPEAKAGQTVEMRYIGKLQNGKIFDSNTKGKPFKFRLGAGEVIKGWDQGIVGMRAGGERLLTVPPGLAYGKKATGGIPANSTLIFECKLLKIV